MIGYPRWDSNPQFPVPKTGALSVALLEQLPTVVLETTTSRLEGERSIQLSYAGFGVWDGI